MGTTLGRSLSNKLKVLQQNDDGGTMLAMSNVDSERLNFLSSHIARALATGTAVAIKLTFVPQN